MIAIALISGGLDSILAARLISGLGIEIIPVNFKIPFCHRAKDNNSASKEAGLIKENLKQELVSIDISEDFLKLLENPRYGFGSNMNPCIDCKILMFSKAKELMQQFGAQFIVTGEVLGQRPMSQHRQALDLIAKKSGLEGLVLRPLSAKNLDETIPEKEGWVEREKLLNFGGRGRTPQIELAGKLGIKDFAWPAGGCLLTDPEFSRRLKDLIEHKELSINNVKLLKLGRHFRLAPDVKLVVGRDEKENSELEKLAQEGDFLFYPNEQLAGPTSLGRGKFNDELFSLASQITCHYCDLNKAQNADIIYRQVPATDTHSLNVTPINKTKLADYHTSPTR